MKNKKTLLEVVELLKEHYRIIKEICDKALEATEVIENLSSEEMEKFLKEMEVKVDTIKLYTITLSAFEAD